MAFSTGYDMGNNFKFSDGLGKLYVGIATTWSIILTCGCLFLIRNCELPFLRIRNIPLTVSAVAVLHVYWVLCLVAYGLNGFFPCATEYWIMNIYLPLGIALFHLSNTKLLHVAVLQRKFTNSDTILSENQALINHGPNWRKRIQILKGLGTYQKTKLAIAIGLIIQLACSLIIFLISRKFHSSFGVIGIAVPDSPLTKRDCRKGWEWLPSIAWQFLWSWAYAPYLLWKVRDIRDTHGWRTQTIICCLAGLPASPMWLFALYLPAMAPVDAYFIPPLWFTPSISLIEAFMIFLPCWQVIKHRRLKKETLEIIAKWEQQKSGTSIETDSTAILKSPRADSRTSSALSRTSSRKAHAHMYTMAALEKALQTNSTPLLLFAALKDFSGENISFLNHVRDWKMAWSDQRTSTVRKGLHTENTHLRFQQFVKAVEIYSSFVSLRYSNFPINISHNHLKELEIMFDGPASLVQTDVVECTNCATPFTNCDVPLHDLENARGKDGISVVSTAYDTASSSTENDLKAQSKQSAVINVYKVKDFGDKMPQSVLIPPNFGSSVFDSAAESIRYMVLTNTWPKFVDAGYAANMEKSTTMDKLHDRLGGCGLTRSRGSSL